MQYMSDPPPTLGPYRISKAWKEQGAILADGKYCSLRSDIADELNRGPGQQIRLRRTADSGSSAAFTVYELHDDDAEIRVGQTGRQRLNVSPSSRVDVRPVVPRPGMSRMDAFERDEICETVWDRGQDTLLVCAPHDGDIESNTAQAAGIVRKELGEAQASAWFVHGFGRDAFNRWHITTTEMDPGSYPGLATIADRGFDHVVSFHVWSDDDGGEILIGGLADDAFREQLADRVSNAINGKRDIITDLSEGKYMAESERNVVNWLTADNASGIQIEMPPIIALRYRKRVARAVAAFYDEKLGDR